MTCPTCGAEAICTDRSTTLIGWYPPSDPDPNWKHEAWRCVNGHPFERILKHGEPTRIRPDYDGHGGVTWKMPGEIIEDITK